MGFDTEVAPSLGDLTFDVEPRREWTPPNPHSPDVAKLWEGSEPLRNITSTSSATVNRSSIRSKPSTRPSTDTRVYDIRKAHPPPMLTPIQKQSSASPSPNKQPTPLTSPSPSPSPIAAPIAPSETAPSDPTRTPSIDAVAENNSAPAPPNVNTPPRKSTISPPRVVCPEPSFTQLSVSELPSVRGQTVTSLSPTGAPTSTSAAAAGVADVGGGGNARGNLGLAAVRPPGMHCSPDPSGVGGYSLADHMSAISSQMNSSQQDPVDAYLARFQIHQRINDQFRVRQDEHFRTLQELGARIQAMTKGVSEPTQSPTRPGEAEQSSSGGAGGPHPQGGEGAVDLSRALSPSAGSSPVRQGTSTGQHPPTQQQAHNRPQQNQQPQSKPLPEHPLQPRNRFIPQPAAASSPDPPPTLPAATATSTAPAAARASGRRRPSSASSVSSCTSPGRSPSVQLLRSGLTGDGTEPSFGPGAAGGFGIGGGSGADPAVAAPSAASPQGPLGSLRAPHPQQGAYLALPDGSFAASPPLRNVPTAEGLLFEKYSKKSQAVDLPELQLRYIRPGIAAPKEPRPQKHLPRQPAPPARALPNGIPASRLERLSARRRDRSPNRLLPQRVVPQQINDAPELLKFNGRPLPLGPATHGSGSPLATYPGGGAATANGLAAVGDGLFQSVSLASPGAMLPYSGGVVFSPARLRSPGVRATSAPSGSEVGGSTGTLVQYLAVSTATPSGEPILDENFYDVLQQHFRSSMHTQTHQLRAQLNVSLPLVLGALNCVNVVDRPGSYGGGGGGTSSMGGSKTSSATKGVGG